MAPRIKDLVLVLVISGVVGLLPAAGAHADVTSFSPAPGSPFATGAGSFADGAAFSPDGNLLAAVEQPSSVSMFSVASTGALTQVTGSPFSTGSAPEAVAFSPDGALLATANVGDNTVSVFSVGESGALQLDGSYSTGNSPLSLAFSPDGSLLAVANDGDSTVSVFAVGENGTLSPDGSAQATGTDPYSVAFSPNGNLLATADEGENTVSIFKVESGGTLSEVSGSPFGVGSGPSSVAFSPDGTLLATANMNDGTVSLLTVNESTGDLTNAHQYSPGGSYPSPFSVAFSPDGSLLAAADSGTNNVAVFTVDDTSGTLTGQLSGSPYSTGSVPQSASFSSSGDMLATANFGGNDVSVFTAVVSSATALSSSENPAVTGQSITYTATVSPVPTGGTVSFTDDGKAVSGCAAVAVSSSTGRASCTVSYTTPGARTIVATFSGEQAEDASNSSALTQAVSAAPAPLITAQSASSITTRTATLSGKIDTHGQAVSWQFQYGPTSGYGHSTPTHTISAGTSAPVAVSAPITGLSAYSSYHYRLIATLLPAAGSTRTDGAARTFTTLPFGALRLVDRALAVTGRTARLRLACDSKRTCAGRFTIKAPPHTAKAAVCATAPERIAAGHTSTVTARLSEKCVARLRHAPNHRLGAQLTIRPRSPQRGINEKITLALGHS